MDYPQDGFELLKLFGDIENAGYVNAVVLTDAAVGFSVQRTYPDNIKFKPAKTAEGKDDSIACIWVVYESKKQSSKNLPVPIRFRIGLMSKYRARHFFDDDDLDPEKPTKVSLAASLGTPQPIELNLRDGYFFDPHTGGLVNEQGTAVRGVDALDEIYQAHCDTVHPVKGLGIRSKQATHSFSRNVLDKLIDSSKWCLKNLFGRTLNERPDRSSYFDGYKGQDFGKLSEDCIEVVGYKVPKRVLGLFIVLSAATAYFLYPIEERSYADIVVHSEVLLTIHCLTGLLFLDVIIPHMIFALVNGLIYIRKRYVNWLLKSIAG
jgi:hypothetical protein